jgi:hypothetical protein
LTAPVAFKGEILPYSILVEELKGRDHTAYLGVDGRIRGNITQSRSVTKMYY